jgi:hypothetical protein
VTIRIPTENFFDKILKIFGKKRRVVLPDNIGDIYKDFGPHVYIQAKKEPILRAIMRLIISKRQELK